MCLFLQLNRTEAEHNEVDHAEEKTKLSSSEVWFISRSRVKTNRNLKIPGRIGYLQGSYSLGKWERSENRDDFCKNLVEF